jgi:hypothetical protein
MVVTAQLLDGFENALKRWLWHRPKDAGNWCVADVALVVAARRNGAANNRDAAHLGKLQDGPDWVDGDEG